MRGDLKETRPWPVIVETLLRNSLAKDFDEARNEWDYVGDIVPIEDNFVSNCELCGTRLYSCNYKISNANTKKNLRIGSECVKRFIVVKGSTSQAESSKLLVKMMRKNQENRNLKGDFVFISNQGNYPDFDELILPFRKRLIKFLKSENKLDLINTASGIKEVFEMINILDYNDDDVYRLKIMLTNIYLYKTIEGNFWSRGRKKKQS